VFISATLADTPNPVRCARARSYSFSESVARALALLCVAVLVIGCTAMPQVNAPIGRVDMNSGYRIADLLKRDQGPSNSPVALVLLAFSGGGTRAAARSNGVLEELRRTRINVKGHAHTMHDEVDMVAGVSGGSFTALPMHFIMHGC